MCSLILLLHHHSHQLLPPQVENSWKNVLYSQCTTFRDYQEQRIDRTRGFFGIGADREMEQRIRNERSNSCEELEDFGIRIPIRA